MAERIQFSADTRIAAAVDKIPQNNCYIQRVADKTGITYSHVVERLNEMADKDLIKFRKNGRRKNIIVKRGKEDYFKGCRRAISTVDA